MIDPEIQSNEQSYIWTLRDVIVIVLGIALFGFVFFLVAFSILIIMATSQYGDILTGGEPTIYLSILAAVLESLTIFTIIYVFGTRRNHYPWQALGLRKSSTGWVVVSIGLGLLAIPLSAIIAYGTQTLFNLPIENPQLPFLIPNDLTPASMALMAIFVGLVIPIAEELFFRGVLYKWLKQRFGIWVGVVLSSIVFGVVHWDIAIASTAFILGIVLALAFEYSRSLWTSILIHAINNGVQIIILYVLVSNGQPPLNF